MALTLAFAACTSGGATDASTSSTASCANAAGLSGSVSDHGTQRATSTSVSLEADDFFFQPTCVIVVPGADLTVTVTNQGQALHNFSVTDLGIDHDVSAGQTITVDVRFTGSAPLAFFCKYHQASGMRGAFLPG